MKIGVSHHRVGDDGTVSCDKKLVFLLDEVKKPDKKRRKKDQGPSAKNFGARIDVVKMKSCTMFLLGWRCRLLAKHIH